MIVEAILNVIHYLLDVLLVLEIPFLPDEVYNYLTQFFDLLAVGAGILANYAPLEYLFTLLGIVATVEVGILVYHLVMWVIRKLPVAVE